MQAFLSRLSSPASRAPPAASQQPAAARRAAPPDAAGRRAAAASLLLAGSLLVLQAQAPPADAFGNGFPGYDLNEAARERAKKALDAEKAVQKRLAAEYRDRKAAEARVGAAGAAEAAAVPL